MLLICFVVGFFCSVLSNTCSAQSFRIFHNPALLKFAFLPKGYSRIYILKSDTCGQYPHLVKHYVTCQS